MKFFLSCKLILLFSISTLAKSATVHITVKDFTGSVSVYNPELRYNLTKYNETTLHFDTHQSTSYTMAIDKPTYLILNFSSSNLKCSLFLSPGDELFLTCDFIKKNDNMLVTGKGSNNNQPEIFALTNMNILPFNDDATPQRVIAAINKHFLTNKVTLANYIKVNKPTAAFIKAARINLQYFAFENYYKSHHSNAFGKPKEQEKNWQKIQDSLFSTIKLNNSDALTGYNYTSLIDNFILGEMGDIWSEYITNPVLFYKQWFHSDTTRGKKLFNYAQAGILINKVIDKYFMGRTADYAYGQSIKYQFLYKANYPSTVLLFDHLKKKYPASVYIKRFSTPIAEVVNKQRQALNSKMIFLTDKDTKLNTFKDVLALIKSKTVLVDMWGTWCGPCREEIEKNTKQLRDHFKGKNVIFLYIANFDKGRENEWKKQIAYFQMEGMHILANPKLTTDIMGKVKATGYPTYVIVKKDGSYKQTATKYPVNLQALIKEIETAEL